MYLGADVPSQAGANRGLSSTSQDHQAMSIPSAEFDLIFAGGVY